MQDSKFNFIFSFLLIVISGYFNNVFATRCTNMTACERYAAADLIFVGKYKKLSPVIQTEGKNLLQQRLDSFEVTELFLGSAEDAKKIVYSSNVNKKQLIDGETYLVYAYQNKINPNVFNTGMCSVYSLTHSEKDLEFLRNIPRQFIQSSNLTGLVETSRDVDISNVTVKLENFDNSLKPIEVKPDKNGNFEIKNLSKGKYKISPYYLGQTIRRLYSLGNDYFEIRGRGCYRVEFFLGKDKDGIFDFN